jgi:hypothetical protein
MAFVFRCQNSNLPISASPPSSIDTIIKLLIRQNFQKLKIDFTQHHLIKVHQEKYGNKIKLLELDSIVLVKNYVNNKKSSKILLKILSYIKFLGRLVHLNLQPNALKISKKTYHLLGNSNYFTIKLIDSLKETKPSKYIISKKSK